MAEDDYGYGDGDFNDDVDQNFDDIEYRPPPAKAPAAAQAPGAGNPYVADAGNAVTGQKRGRDLGDEHHVDVNTPEATAPATGGRNADESNQNGDGYYDNYQPQAAKRSAGGAPGSQHIIPTPYDYNGNGGTGAYGAPNGGDHYSGGAAAGPGPGGSSPNPPATNAPSCQCDQPCIRRVSNTGKNPGRAFFKCPKPQGEQCSYFKWEDELGGEGAPAQSGRGAYGGGVATSGYGGGHKPYTNNQAASTSGPATNQAGGGTGAYGGGSGAYGGGADAAGGPVADGGDEPVKCMCGIDCPVKTSNSANNPGRQFFACPKMRDDATRCRFFQWADEVGTGALGGGGGGGGGGGVGGGGGGASGNCFICQQPGHFASSCPQKGAGGGGGYGGRNSFGAGGGGGGGGASGGAPCFLCQQTGHWARDCPTKQGGGGGGGYGGGGGPPQSFASRFGREGGGYGGGGGGYGGGGGGYGGGGGGYGGGYGGAGGGGGNKGTCYKCGQPGHWANSCPNAR
ncbi:hypothetical protein PLESTB_000152200 [Pleodorina starrii]|uniref:Uncharacterized protein n=1 Tax=Pleodorina starrii TaxID=330485 RepID=A0A9W6BBN5_9CHLO|nr:hypothetical protein PLESTM_000451000 [Pleodorina starrii]GLC48820.1 hypothetical protein PLESTB_000152200 [Pleodorina starrii]GLC72559.1 hypothetical protein PLESTF_001264700 [Pleodorina starrii]